MSDAQDLEKIFDSMPRPDAERRDTPQQGTRAVAMVVPAEGPGAAAPAPEPPGFDPYKFQVLTVSPTLRQELVGAKLARLDPEYFHDTLPPGRIDARSTSSMPPAVGDTVDVPLPSAHRRSRDVVVALLVGAVAGALCWLWFDPPPGSGGRGGPPAAAAIPAPVPPRAPTQATRQGLADGRPTEGVSGPPATSATPAPGAAPAGAPRATGRVSEQRRDRGSHASPRHEAVEAPASSVSAPRTDRPAKTFWTEPR